MKVLKLFAYLPYFIGCAIIAFVLAVLHCISPFMPEEG